jgi:CDP-diacylglycerol--serine O-phosphatidyltransferase
MAWPSKPDGAVRVKGPGRGLPLRVVAPNAITALALCFGLTGVRFAISADWDKAVASIFVAGLLDGLDGRVARLLKAQSRFGAELDSLSDVIAFGVAPSVVLYLWSLSFVPKYGWVLALTHAVACALRLARFNAQIDADTNPRRALGYLTGVPAPAGAALALLPLVLWLAGDGWLDVAERTYVVAPWTVLVAILMISEVATFGAGSFRLRRGFRLPALLVIPLLGGALLTAPWATLSVLILAYAVSLPLAERSYRRLRQRRASASPPAPHQA